MYAENNNAKAFFYAVVVYILLAILCFLGIISVPAENIKPLGGIEVNIGTSDQGMGEDFSSIAEPSVSSHPNVHVRSARLAESEPVRPEREKAAPQKEKELLTQANEEAAELRSRKLARQKELLTAVTKTARKPVKEIINQNALYKGRPAPGTGGGDGNTGAPGNEGKPNGSVLSHAYSGTGTGTGGVALNLEGRRFLVKPSLSDEGQSEGRIAVDISVAKDGSIAEVKAGGRGTTIQNASLWRKCEDAVRQCRLNSISDGPDIQTGKVIFTFKLQ